MKEKVRLWNGKKPVPIFLAADDVYEKYMMVTIRSVIANTTEEYQYNLHILHTDISADNQAAVRKMETSNCKISFVDVSDELKKIEKKITLRDYYTATTYYRIFIADLFPEYDKVIYIDSDTILLTDIAELYQYHPGKNYVGAVRDQLVVQEDIYGDYVEKVLGISRGAYFNAGVVLINCEQFREKNMLKQLLNF